MCFTLQKHRPKNLGWSLYSYLEVSDHLLYSFKRYWWHVCPLEAHSCKQAEAWRGRFSLHLLGV